MAVSIIIDGENKTRQVESGSLQIQNILTNKRDACDFVINKKGSVLKEYLTANHE